MTRSRKIIVVDDSNNPKLSKSIRKLGKEVIVIKAGPYPGGAGGLMVKISQGYKYACQNFDFKLILRIDCDALIIGSGAEKEAERYFKMNPTSAIVGSYRVDCNDQTRSIKWAARMLRKETSLLGLSHPSLRKRLKKLVQLARQNAYAYGESCLGGAVFQSRRFTMQMYSTGILDEVVFKDSKLGEDHIFGLIAIALGYKLGDFATGDLPMGLQHRGLPDSPENLLKRGKKIIHSVDFWGDMDGASIRHFFREKRQSFIVGG